MAETVYVDTANEDADRLYNEFLKRFGLDSVGCQAYARALLPAPFNLESYTFTARGGASWTWDVAFISYTSPPIGSRNPCCLHRCPTGKAR